MRKEFELRVFEEILNDIKYGYLKNLNKKEMFWQCAQYNFLFRALKESFKHENGDSAFGGDYAYRVQTYFEETIQARVKYHYIPSCAKLKGKILAFDVHSSMFDCLGEKETGGFIDGSDTPPPEFWIHFDGENLYSFIPNELTNIVDLAIDISMSGSLEWHTDVIEI
ncbi:MULTISPECIES: hypothetical protein [Acinetobacter calcoaceticus/baumannii complex]|uniref:Uncharacterized protein n=1 Tax=Acinetobacter nosocomialis TaxID=106654 RepID=A0AB36LYG4_ACINO|nr:MULTISPECIES: hypothetical protein [Acinetobacter calcoaceticus/baumannii complex]KCY50346.1 hypothetical protein J715_0850 [Acinetobacter baumannii 1571545]KCZ33063.1 hypothetical protein J812_1535 [Acinetobacter baumannii 25977_9]SSR82838.1 Uncharacterised protein [Acinetobacter baumannii]EXB68499.1 hypothetical protein J525_2116 [Acinetobacter sp. 21871]EXR33340.1 hypothetical protein J689_1678 [Acinetobacter sp. 1179249]